MNRRLVALIVAAVVVIFIVIMTFAFRKSPTASADTCKEFIAAIQEGKSEDSFNMFTTKAKGQTSQEIWKKQVEGFKIAYVNGSLRLTSTNDATPVGGDQQTRFVYEVKSGGWRYEATCFVQDSQIDAFSSTTIQ